MLVTSLSANEVSSVNIHTLITQELDKKEYKLKTLHHSTEYTAIKNAADRNDCIGDLLIILYAIRKAENGRAGLEFGVMHPKAKNTNLDTQAAWAAATVVKCWDRFENAPEFDGKVRTFIRFLGQRYCPPDDHKLNKNWQFNVYFYYDKFRRYPHYMETINGNS